VVEPVVAEAAVVAAREPTKKGKRR